MSAAEWGKVDPAAPFLPPVPIVTTKRGNFFIGELLAHPAAITSIDYPGVRVADAIHKLRGCGLEIETVYEDHGGEFSGRHARYRLVSSVVRLSSATGSLMNPVSTQAVAP